MIHLRRGCASSHGDLALPTVDLLASFECSSGGTLFHALIAARAAGQEVTARPPFEGVVVLLPEETVDTLVPREDVSSGPSANYFGVPFGTTLAGEQLVAVGPTCDDVPTGAPEDPVDAPVPLEVVALGSAFQLVAARAPMDHVAVVAT
jgi:hypothetical protein